MLNVLKEQQINEKFLFKNGKSAAETYFLRNVYGNKCLLEVGVFECFFSYVQENIEDDVCSDRLSTSTTEENFDSHGILYLIWVPEVQINVN